MITYEEALKIASELKHGIDHCSEWTDAYIFIRNDEMYDIGGDGPCVVLKENGRAVCMVEYTDFCAVPGAEMIREFDIK